MYLGQLVALETTRAVGTWQRPMSSKFLLAVKTAAEVQTMMDQSSRAVAHVTMWQWVLEVTTLPFGTYLSTEVTLEGPTWSRCHLNGLPQGQ